MIETSLTCVDAEFSTNQVLASLFYCFSDGEQFPDIGESHLHLWVEAFAEKTMGRSSWDNTAPAAMLDASVVTSKGFVKLGSVSVVSDDMESLSF